MKVDIFMASMPRGYHVLKTVASLINQPETRTITIVANNYSRYDLEYVRKELRKYSNVEIFTRDNVMGCSERFFPLAYFGKNYTGKYIAFVDDDLIYPEDYLRRLILGADKYKCLVSWHGRVLKTGKADNYYKHKTNVFMCLGTVEVDVEVDIIGTGASLVERSLIKGIENYYKQIEHGNMSDIYFSYLAKQNGLKRVVLAHKEGDLLHKEKQEGDGYIFDLHKNNCKPQTDFINKYFAK